MQKHILNSDLLLLCLYYSSLETVSNTNARYCVMMEEVTRY